MTTIHTRPIQDRSAWHSAELEADPAWRYTLTSSECEEIYRITTALRQQGLSTTDVNRAHFALPTLHAKLSELADELENGRGVVVVRGLPVDDYDDEALRLAYWGIINHFGTPISQNSKGQRMAEVSDRGNDLSQTNTRGYSTSARLGPHTDMCEMTSLLCVHTALEGGESQVASAMAVFNHLLEHHPEHLEVLFRGFYHDLRGEGPTASIDEVTHHRVPVFSYHEGRLSFSFNPKTSMNGALKRGDTFLPEEQAALDCVSNTAVQPEFSHAMWLERGDIQVVNNHTVLHSRNEYKDASEGDQRRKLYRIWMQPHLQRPLTDDFSNRYNTGPRGGVAKGDGAQYEF
jgi:alpha-ketoglutarate-dependent taurine dioxygenase